MVWADMNLWMTHDTVWNWNELTNALDDSISIPYISSNSPYNLLLCLDVHLRIYPHLDISPELIKSNKGFGFGLRLNKLPSSYVARRKQSRAVIHKAYG